MELVLRPKPDAKPIDEQTAERIRRVARADAAELAGGGAAVFAFSLPAEEARGNLELAARFELGAHWHTRYEVAAGR